jgi:hypothetical protein
MRSTSSAKMTRATLWPVEGRVGGDELPAAGVNEAGYLIDVIGGH